MTTATLTTSTLASAPSTTVGFALKELGVATQHLAKAVWVLVTASLTFEAKEPNPQQAVRELRAFASSIAASDPGFASDLFAAADRHEFGDSA